MNLLETNEFTTSITCSLPGDGADVRREFKFDATFELIPQDEWEDMIEQGTLKSDAIRRVLKSVGPQVQGGKVKDKEGNEVEISPVEAVIRNPISCDATFAKYTLYISKDSRDQAMNAAERKNSRRSRR